MAAKKGITCKRGDVTVEQAIRWWLRKGPGQATRLKMIEKGVQVGKLNGRVTMKFAKPFEEERTIFECSESGEVTAR